MSLGEVRFSDVGNTLLVSQNEKCLICRFPYSESDKKCSFLACEHLYHKDCLDPWLAKSNTCPAPLCGKKVVVPLSSQLYNRETASWLWRGALIISLNYAPSLILGHLYGLHSPHGECVADRMNVSYDDYFYLSGPGALHFNEERSRGEFSPRQWREAFDACDELPVSESTSMFGPLLGLLLVGGICGVAAKATHVCGTYLIDLKNGIKQAKTVTVVIEEQIEDPKTK